MPSASAEGKIVIDSQPSASRPRNSRASARRPKVIRRNAAARGDAPEASRWKVRLELAPSEIAFVYRKGLARGAEVCRRGTHEWRPLVTTPELRDALATRASLAEMIEASPALSLSQTLAIDDPSLAALFLQRRAPQLPKTAPPPPPAITRSAPPPPLVSRVVLPKPVQAKSEPPPMAFVTTETIPPAPRAPRLDSISDAEDTPLVPLRVAPFLPARLMRALSGRRIVHARPFELSLVAGLAIVTTLLVTALTLRIEAPRMNALISSARHSKPKSAVESAPNAPSLAAPASTIPVVPVVDLPVEAGHGAVLANLAPSYATPGSHAASASARAPSAAFAPGAGPDRAALSRALGGAAAAARNCGEGPVSAQVVVTYAPSGVARDIHFAAAPPLVMRSCVLNAVARSRVAPFTGDPVTVSKTLRW